MNDLAELKRFIISEMKNKNSEWKDCGRYSSYFRFESKYIGIYKKDGGSNSYERKVIFNLIQDLRRFILKHLVYLSGD
jgi:hypothetical protein